MAIGDLSESDCRACHSSGVPNRHHLLYGQPIPPGSIVPYPDIDGDGSPDSTYGCLNCHGRTFTVTRDCTVCHSGSSPHHTTPTALGGNCQACHGSVVDNMTDGHYIPSYSPSLVTPAPNDGDGLPLNSRGNGSGACDYCHDDDGLATPVILSNQDLHHGTGLSNCNWCHDFNAPPEARIRTCEGCHGPNSLHNIQADSPKTPTGTIVVGGELAGYGHVGRDAGPGDSDCWGCHGFAFAEVGGAEELIGGPIIPTIGASDVQAMKAGTASAVVVTGSAFTNTAGATWYESQVALTDADGSAVILAPDSIDQGILAVTIPGHTAPGNYDLRAVKAGFASNPAVISVVPEVIVARATRTQRGRTVTITGSGFAGYAAGSGTGVTGTVGRGKKAKTVEGKILSWTDGAITAAFRRRPRDVTVHSVFGAGSGKVARGGRRAP